MSEKKELTEEDRARIHEEAQAVLDRVMGRSTNPPRAKKQPVFSKQERARRALAAKRYDHAEMVRLHTAEGLGARQIAEKLGCNRTTVINVLKKHAVYNPKLGRPKAERCERGHDQSTHRRESSPGKQDWHCGKCKRERDAEYRKARAAKRRDNRIEPHGNGWDIILEGESVGIALMSVPTAHALNEKLRNLSRNRWNQDG